MAAVFKLKHTLILPNLGEVNAVIHAKYSPGYPGSRYKRNGDPGDPPEPAEIEVIKITVKGVDITNSIGPEIDAIFKEELEENDNFREAIAELYEESQMPEEP